MRLFFSELGPTVFQPVPDLFLALVPLSADLNLHAFLFAFATCHLIRLLEKKLL
jgi:hypothetical protein